MVPDEQAAIIADWMSRHPQQTASLLDVIRPKVTSGTGPEAPTSANLSVPPGDISPERTQGEAGAAVPLPAQTEDTRVTELENGVKVIRLPHGGIRVTTREEGNE
ncbi:hypothetical protein ACWAU3_08055 [Shewanella sp. JL219SE-S6]